MGGHLQCESGTISPQSLVSLIDPAKLRDFLDAVASSNGVVERELGVEYAGSMGRILLHGAETPFGILVLANLPSVDPAARKCIALMKAETETARQLLDAVHEIRNPISSIISSCEFLEGYTTEGLGSEQAEIIKGIGSAAEAMLTISGKVGDLAMRLMGTGGVEERRRGS